MVYTVEKENENNRIDLFISIVNKDITRSYASTLIKEEKILVNSKIVKPSYKVKEGDKVEIEYIKPKEIDAVAQDIKLDIVYEDDDIIIINKPKGMVVHPGNGNYEGTIVNALLYTHKDNLSTINGVIRPGIVHRIDKDTTGLIVVAKNDKAHKCLSEQFKEHSNTRKYIALVKGIIKKDDLDINLPIGRNPKDRVKMAVTLKNSKNAITHIHVLERYYVDNLTLVEAVLETGRTHQIRVHMSHIKHPLVGDEVYGKKDKRFKTDGQMLHAKTLGFIHPTTGKYIEFDSNLPEYFENILKKLK